MNLSEARAQAGDDQGKWRDRRDLQPVRRQEIKINDGSNVLQIKNGKAEMIEADCPDKFVHASESGI